MSFTVVPMYFLELPPETKIRFGSEFFLQDIPTWFRDDRHLLRLGENDRGSLPYAKHALVAEYEAGSIGEADPNWKGLEPRSIQAAKEEAAITANLALWIAQPSPASFTWSFQALSSTPKWKLHQTPVILHSERSSPLHCHPNDVTKRITSDEAGYAGRLHEVLVDIPRKNPVWQALRAAWAGLTSYTVDRRYPFFWIAIESLFGADDAREIGYKMAQRIAFFLTDSPDSSREKFRVVKKCYETRSKIVHGRWDDDPKIDHVMADSEQIVRDVFRRLLGDPEMLKAFMSKHRDKFLEDWVFSRSTEPPPYPA